MKRTLVVTGLALGLVLSSCASSNADDERRQTYTGPITHEEVQEAGVLSNAYDVVRQLRPTWLRTRGARSVTNPNPPDVPVYIDGVIRYGSTSEALASIPSSQIKSIDRLDARRAQNRLGMGHPAGAFIVELR